MYKLLLEGHEKYGTPKEMLCQAVLGCSNEAIRENVIIAPWWEPNVLEGIEANIIAEGTV